MRKLSAATPEPGAQEEAGENEPGFFMVHRLLTHFHTAFQSWPERADESRVPDSHSIAAPEDAKQGSPSTGASDRDGGHGTCQGRPAGTPRPIRGSSRPKARTDARN